MAKRITVGVALTLMSFPLLATDRNCSTSDFQACRTCAELEAGVDYRNPNAGDYYRGANWNGFYAAYVVNCPVIAAKLIKAGANPAHGGLMGSMIMTVSGKWPHDNQAINEAWAALILAAGASIVAPLKWNDGTTEDVLVRESWFAPDYPDLLALFKK